MKLFILKKKLTMKTEKAFYSVLCLLFLFFTFTACNNDDEDGIAGDAQTLIIGTWRVTSGSGYDIVDGVRENWSESYDGDDYYAYTFNSNGTGIFEEAWGNGWTFTWSISGNEITVTEGADVRTRTILTLNTSRMVWSEYTVAEYGNTVEEYYVEEILQKIN